MKNVHHNKAFSLTELLVVVGVISLLVGIGIPATRAIMDSVNSSAGIRTMLAAAFNNARAMAIKFDTPAGIRFQTDSEGNQYMVYIIKDDVTPPSAAALAVDPTLTGTGLAYGYRALEGQKPIKLPGQARVMDLNIRGNIDPAFSLPYTDVRLVTASVADTLLDADYEINDASNFSIIFSHTGKLIITEVRLRNRHGQTAASAYISTDKLYNIAAVVEADPSGAKFYQDDYTDPSVLNLGLGQEFSRNNFVIYDKNSLDLVDPSVRWSDYLSMLQPVYLNPYSGALVGGQLEDKL